MESTTANNTNATLETTLPMTRFSIEEEDDDVPVHIKRPRLSASTSQSRRPVNRSHPRVVTDETEEEDTNNNNQVPIEEVDSDSDGYEESEPLEPLQPSERLGPLEQLERLFQSDEEVGTDEDEDEEEEEEMRSSRVGEFVGGVSSVAVGNRDVSTGLPVFNDVSGELKVVLTDPDVLDCPICLEPLSTPVFQCENGHIACSSCCSKVKRKCPSCCMPIGYNRCRAIEKVIEAVKVSCKNAQYGCKMTTTYSKKIEHEQLCPFVTCFCPHPSCPFAGSSNKMYLHAGIQHAASTTRFTYNTTFFVHVATQQKHIFLQEQHESVIFILNHEVKEHGRALSVDCVGPSTLKSCFEYQITARRLESTLSLQSVPDIYTRWSEHPLKKNYLTVPSDFFCCSGTLPIHLCIKKVVTPA